MDRVRAEPLVQGYVHWHLAIGDPTLAAWLIVAGYAIAAVLSVRAFLTVRSGSRRLDGIDPDEAANQRLLARLWAMVAVTMVVLGINKQLDLQTLVLQVARERAVAGGWYPERRRYQVDFIAVALLAGTAATAALTVVMRRVLWRVLPALGGLALLVVFVVVRAASYHDVDRVLALGGFLRLARSIELAGVLLVAAAAAGSTFTERRRVVALAAAGARPVGPSRVPSPPRR